jgi:2-polyprenyl-6-methoxyphenol hydroxylase-like FAD-dependent oxidoreductase
MLLARKGYKVLLVDRATFPSDSMRNHWIRIPGVQQLHRWGLLEQIKETGCPPVRTYTIDLGDFPLTGTGPNLGDEYAEYGPRRYVLDKLLLEAASEAGVEVREAFSVRELLSEDGRVEGIRGNSKGGGAVSETARIVIGADGQHSLVARTVGASTYNERPALTCGYYSYWSGLPCEGQEIFIRNSTMALAFLTNDGLVCVAVQRPVSDFSAFRADLEGFFMNTLARAAPDLVERARSGKREERFYGTADLPNFFRKPYGPGWALVGDAGYHKDPITARGISDAFRDAELLAVAVDASLSGGIPMQDALADYEQKRNEAALPTYEEACQAASFTPFPPQLLEVRARIRGNQALIDKYMGLGVGSVQWSQFVAALEASGYDGRRTTDRTKSLA